LRCVPFRWTSLRCYTGSCVYRCVCRRLISVGFVCVRHLPVAHAADAATRARLLRFIRGCWVHCVGAGRRPLSLLVTQHTVCHQDLCQHLTLRCVGYVRRFCVRTPVSRISFCARRCRLRLQIRLQRAASIACAYRSLAGVFCRLHWLGTTCRIRALLAHRSFLAVTSCTPGTHHQFCVCPRRFCRSSTGRVLVGHSFTISDMRA